PCGAEPHVVGADHGEGAPGGGAGGAGGDCEDHGGATGGHETVPSGDHDDGAAGCGGCCGSGWVSGATALGWVGSTAGSGWSLIGTWGSSVIGHRPWRSDCRIPSPCPATLGAGCEG